MFKIDHARQLLLITVCALGMAACGKSDEEPQGPSPLTDSSGLLRYVPADTPYVFGTLAPPPDEFMDSMEPKIDRLLAAYSEVLRVAVSEAESADDGDSDETERVDAVVEELRSLMSVEGLREVGFTRDSTVILYGNGLLPVLRATLSDASLFDEAISRIETSAGEQLPVAEVQGTAYRYVEDEGVRVIIATVGNELVLTVAPESLDDASLASLLGLTLPDDNIADSGELRDIARFVAQELGVDTPWHVSRFHPTYRMLNRPATPVDTLHRAREIGLEEGLNYVYEGNVPGSGGENTICPECGQVVIRRTGFAIRAHRAAVDA